MHRVVCLLKSAVFYCGRFVVKQRILDIQAHSVGGAAGVSKELCAVYLMRYERCAKTNTWQLNDQELIVHLQLEYVGPFNYN